VHALPSMPCCARIAPRAMHGRRQQQSNSMQIQWRQQAPYKLPLQQTPSGAPGSAASCPTEMHEQMQPRQQSALISKSPLFHCPAIVGLFVCGLGERGGEAWREGVLFDSALPNDAKARHLLFSSP